MLCSAYRTPICKSKRGGFKDTHPDDLLAAVLKVLLFSVYFAWNQIIRNFEWKDEIQVNTVSDFTDVNIFIF